MYNGVYDKEQFAYLHHTLRKWLRLKLEGGGLGDRLYRAGFRSAAVYGAGGLGEEVLLDLNNSPIEVRCLIDRRAAEYPEGLNGLPVLDIETYTASPSDDIVLVTPEYYFREIAEDLTKAGIPLERIISLAMALEQEDRDEDQTGHIG